jgi:hypothetical protein
VREATVAERVRVSVFDPATGDTETAELPPDSYILLMGEFMEISAFQEWPRSGTVQITLKRKDAPEPARSATRNPAGSPLVHDTTPPHPSEIEGER